MFPKIKPSTEERFQIMMASSEIVTQDSMIYCLLDICKIDILEGLQTAYVCWDKSSKLYQVAIGWDFLKSMSVEETSSVIMHELYHILFGHVVFNRKQLEGLNIEILGVAQDAIINENIPFLKSGRVTGHPILDGRVQLKKINKKFDSRNTTSEEVYEYLLKKTPEELEEMGGLGDLLDDHSEMEMSEGGQGEGAEVEISEASIPQESENGEGGESPKPISLEGDEEFARMLLKQVIQSNSQKFVGTGSAQVDRSVGEILKTDYDPCKLLDMATRKSLRGTVSYSWKKINRKMGEMFRGKKTLYTPRILIVTDLSGSIDEDVIAMVRYQHAVLSKKYEIYSCWGDTTLKGEKKIRRGERVVLPFKGGGGTDLNFYLPVANHKQFDLIIVNTDGYIPKMKMDKYKTQKIFCIYPGGVEVPGFKNIRIKESMK